MSFLTVSGVAATRVSWLSVSVMTAMRIGRLRSGGRAGWARGPRFRRVGKAVGPV